MFRHRGSCVWRQHARPLALWSPTGWRWWAGLARRATWRHKTSDVDSVQWATYLPVWTQLTPTTQNWPQLMNDETMTQPTERLTSCTEICSRLYSLTTQHSHQCADTDRPYCWRWHKRLLYYSPFHPEKYWTDFQFIATFRSTKVAVAPFNTGVVQCAESWTLIDLNKCVKVFNVHRDQSFNSGNDRTHLEIQYNGIKWLKYIEREVSTYDDTTCEW